MFDSLPAVIAPHVCVGCAATGRRLLSSAEHGAKRVTSAARPVPCTKCTRSSRLSYHTLPASREYHSYLCARGDVAGASARLWPGAPYGSLPRRARSKLPV